MLSAIILGIIQGSTEFLPVSSTGHLIITHELLGFETADNALFDIILQLATAIAAIIYFRNDIWNIAKSFFIKEEGETRKLGYAVIIGTIPAVIVGFLFEEQIENIFRNSEYVAYALIAGSILMFAAERLQKISFRNELSIIKGLIVGCFQALALIPGISRSGSTISGGLLAGLDRELAVRFSFLLSIPIITGAALKKLLSADVSILASFEASLILGFLASFAVGIASIHFLTMYLRTRTFNVFIWYRVALALVLLLLVYSQSI